MTIKLSQAYESSRRQTYVQEPPRQVGSQCYAAHFQLRDLVISPVAGKIALANGNNINGITWPQDPSSKAPIQRTHLFDLPFAPVCFSYGCGLIALGGQSSELSIRTLQPPARSGPTGWDKANFNCVGDNINNSVAIVPRPGSSNLVSGEAATPVQARLILSNNDQSIGIWDVHSQSLDVTPIESEAMQLDQDPDMCPITLKKRALLQPAETAINYCSVSKDGRFMTAVGDTNQVFFYSCPQNPNDERGYKLIHTVRASEDAMFSADWSRDNATCAVASQDGLVSVFDVRCLRTSSSDLGSPHIVTQFQTSKAAAVSRSRGAVVANPYGMNGAARTVKFSPGCTTELLAFTEQSRWFHLVDARSLDPSSHRVCELPRSSLAPNMATEDAYWRSLLHPLGSAEIDFSRNARLRVERERYSPSTSLLSATRQRLRQQEALADWAFERDDVGTSTNLNSYLEDTESRHCLDSAQSDAPVMITTLPHETSERQSLHTFFYGSSATDSRQSPRSRARDTSSNSRQTLDEMDVDGPQLQPDGSFTLGPDPSASSSARTSRRSRPGILPRTDSEEEQLRASLGLLNMPGWADVSAHDPLSISGMDWDPRGERLYLATSTTAYEYQVNLCGRNSLPEAVIV